MAGDVPASVTLEELRAISARAGERTGWDFSRIRAVEDPGAWRYEEVVAEVTVDGDRVLDVGTGGGEVLAALPTRHRWRWVGALDHDEGMATVARQRLDGDGVPVLVGDAGALPLAGGCVDLVLNRHAQVCPTEIARVLGPGGRFVLQQVGDRNAHEIFDAFGWGANWEQFADDPIPPRRCPEIAAELEACGMRVERVDEYAAGYAFRDLDSVVFFLRSAPFPEEFDPERHLDGINRLLATSRSTRGVETTAHRELLVARRPADRGSPAR